MSAAKPEMVREESILTPAQDKQMQRIDQNGDGMISKKEARAEARFAAEQVAKLSFWKKVALGIAALLFFSCNPVHPGCSAMHPRWRRCGGCWAG